MTRDDAFVLARCSSSAPHQPHNFFDGSGIGKRCSGYAKPNSANELIDQVRSSAMIPPEWPWPELPLPVETELIDDAWYADATGGRIGVFQGEMIKRYTWTLPVWLRLAPVARYEPPKPETPEPTGLGAVVRDADGVLWVRMDWKIAPWLSHENGSTFWSDGILTKPVEVLSEGVQL